MYFSEKVVGARRYLIAAQAVWDTKAGQAYSRQVVLGPAGRAPCVERNPSASDVRGAR
jgi:hypothetical protein